MRPQSPLSGFSPRVAKPTRPIPGSRQGQLVLSLVKVNSNYAHVKQAGSLSPGTHPGVGFCERSATTESGAASGQRMPFPDYVSAQGPVPTPWTQVDPVVFSRLRRAAPGDLQRPCGCAWSNSGRMVENVSRRARSVDVFQQGRFLFPCQPLPSPLPKSQPKDIKG